jgi:putative serine protease PepD
MVVALVVAGGIGALLVAALDDDGSSSTVATAAAVAASCAPARVARQGLPSVVMITVEAGRSAGTGSGEIINRDGDILTNNHVISAAADGGTISVLFSDGASADTQLVGRDPQTDLAVIKVRTPVRQPPIQFGRSAQLVTGDQVFALGAPLGFPNTVTAGIVSALDRSVQVPSDNGGTALLVAAIQTDAAINPGNSGGALVDCDARLVGIPSAGAVVPSPTGGSEGNIGIGFAIPADFAKAVSDEIITSGKATHGYLGIQVAPVVPSGATSSGARQGLFVVAVVPRGPSDQAGVQAGDIITEIDGKPAKSAEDLQAVTLTKNPGDRVQLTLDRNGTEQTVNVILGTAPTSP